MKEQLYTWRLQVYLGIGISTLLSIVALAMIGGWGWRLLSLAIRALKLPNMRRAFPAHQESTP